MWFSKLKKIFNPFASEDENQKEPITETKTSSEEKPAPAVAKEEKKPEPEPVPAQENKGKEKKEEPAAASPVISDIGTLKETIKELIIDAVAPFTGGDDSFVGMSIWINSQFSYIIDTEPFITSLRAAFDSMKLRALGSGDIRIIPGEPAESDGATPLYKKDVLDKGTLWFRLINRQNVKPKSSKATISVFEGLGSCRESEYILDGGVKTTYRIGRGAYCQKSGAAYRINDIVIEDNDPDTNKQKLNSFVSSAHADILIEDGRFYLKAMPWGCRTTGGSPTKIIRDQNPYELRDTHSSFLLQDGDLIELGKKVLLKFSIIPE